MDMVATVIIVAGGVPDHTDLLIAGRPTAIAEDIMDTTAIIIITVMAEAEM
jgi:hypothetical protein